MLKEFIFYLQLIRVSIRASISKRGAFLMECLFMLANNFIFFTMWWIFFRQFNDIAGWKFPDMMAVMTVGMGSWGIMQVCFGGSRFLSRSIVNGELDPFMTQPKNLLLQLLGSRSLTRGWGHLLTSLILIFLGGLIPKIPLILIFIMTGGIVFTSIAVMIHSVAFWVGSMEGLAKKMTDITFLFAHYPTNIYSGLLQVVMFTIFPAGIIGFVPVELLRNFSLKIFILLIISSLIFAFLAFKVFYLGLKKYESGNRFGIRY